jgi:hypothetical protein
MIVKPEWTMIGEVRKVLKRLHYPLEVMLVCARCYAAYPLGIKDPAGPSARLSQTQAAGGLQRADG